MIAGPRFLELADTSVAEQRTRVAPWLSTVQTLQAAFCRLVADTVPLVDDPVVADLLSGVHRAAREHEDVAAELFAVFELSPPAPGVTGLAGAVLGRAREVAGQVQGVLAGGRHSAAWRNLRQLQLSNLDALSGFAVVESLGLALGRPRAVELSFAVQGRKTEDQLLLRELFLEFATDAVLRRR